jgi:hypothetical protein
VAARSTEPIRIRVAMTGGGRDATTLEPELRMVKSALLYADHVSLTSPTMQAVGALAWQSPPDAQFERAVEASGITAAPGWDAAFAAVVAVQRRGGEASGHEDTIMKRCEAELARYGAFRRASARRHVEEAGGAELQLAVGVGVLDLEDIDDGSDDPQDRDQAALDRLQDVFIECGRAATPTFPMFDPIGLDGRGGLRRSAAPEPSEGPIQAAMATGLVAGRIEMFPHAPMDVVLDVRDRLAGPLARVQGALAHADRRMRSAPVDGLFVREVQELFRAGVQPVLDELGERLRDEGALEALRPGGPGSRVTGYLLASTFSTFAQMLHGVPDDSAFGPPASAEPGAVGSEGGGSPRNRHQFYFLPRPD